MPARAAGHGDAEVAALLRDLDHPLKKEIESVRKIVLGASPEIREGVKWNSASFRTTEWFATINLRSKDAVQLVFHLGAKKRSGPVKLDIADPDGLIRWLAPDRCLVTLGAGRDVAKRRAAFEKIVRAWIRQVP